MVEVGNFKVLGSKSFWFSKIEYALQASKTSMNIRKYENTEAGDLQRNIPSLYSVLAM